MRDLTTDTFFKGRLQVRQPQTGYRFSIDAVLLACNIKSQPGDSVLDLGTGCGIVPLILAYQNKEIKIYGVEIQKELADIALINVKENNMEDQISIICRDMKNLKHGMISGPADIVVCNPPFRKPGSGRMNPDLQKAVARHEIKINLDDVIYTACRMLRTSGKFIMIYSAQRMIDMFTEMRSNCIEPKFCRMIHSNISSEAKLVLVEGIKGGNPGIKTGKPLLIYQKDGSYTDEVKLMMG